MVARGLATIKTASDAGGWSHATNLLAWYDRHRRKLPWRAEPGESADPYAVWLSEIMLQQTTVKAVAPYFQRFLARWPDVAALAAAPIDEVMREWAGLGYYSRARSLHACARIVAERGGGFPADEQHLLALPGIGPYTAAAIAAIAFGQRAVVVDGNVERVVTRLFAIEQPLPQAKPAIKAATATLTPDVRAGDFAQAMMDLGATICTPKRPACALCPFLPVCAAHARGNAESFPRKAAKTLRPHRAGAVFYLRRADGHVLLRTRPPQGLLGGMAEFPGSAWMAAFDLATALASAPLAAAYRQLDAGVVHVFTHFALHLTVYLGCVDAHIVAPEGTYWVPDDELDRHALPSLMRKVVALVVEQS